MGGLPPCRHPPYNSPASSTGVSARMNEIKKSGERQHPGDGSGDDGARTNDHRRWARGAGDWTMTKGDPTQDHRSGIDVPSTCPRPTLPLPGGT